MAKTELTSLKIGRFIEKKRLQQGLTQKELAAILKVDQSALSRIEAGMQKVDIIRWVKFCRAVGILRRDRSS